MEASEGLGEALRGLVAVFKGDIDDLLRAPLQIQGRLIEPTIPEVLADAIAGHEGKAPLQEEGREVHLPGHVLETDRLPQMSLHIADGRADRGEPLHGSVSFP